MDESVSPKDSFEREEWCRRSIKTLWKAVLARLFLTGLLVWILLQGEPTLWMTVLMILLTAITLGPLIPLGRELKQRRAELKALRRGP